jgi:hypothetical protein
VRYHNESTRVASIHGFASHGLGTLLGVAVLILASKPCIALVALTLVLLGYLYSSGSPRRGVS